MVRSSFFILSFVVFILSSCGEGKVYKPNSTGMPGEVIVIAEDEYWRGPVGDTLSYYLEQVQMGLPQQEPIFSLGQYNHNDFSKVIKSHRNIILFEIDSDNEKFRVEYLKDVWAKDQVVIKIVARNEEQAIDLFKKDAASVIEVLNTTEYDRIVALYSSKEQTAIKEELKKDLQLEVTVPDDYKMAENRKTFIWLKSDKVKYVSGEAHDINQGVFIYTYPYVDDSTFTLEYLLKVRDSVCKANVPGPSEGSYMSTERDSAYYPVWKESTLNGKYAFEIRGLYRTEGDAYGGPFISITTFDEPRGRIVTVEGYVFAPKFGKREYIREMAAICYSLRFDGEK